MRAFAAMMRTKPDVIEGQGKGSFAATIRNQFPSAVSLRFPFGTLEASPQMTEAEFAIVRAKMRERYAVPLAALAQPSPPSPQGQQPKAAPDEQNQEIKPQAY
jgi:hypothetical protein